MLQIVRTSNVNVEALFDKFVQLQLVSCRLLFLFGISLKATLGYEDRQFLYMGSVRCIRLVTIAELTISLNILIAGEFLRVWRSDFENYLF